MSTGTTFLPEPAPIIAGDQEMLTAWESVRHWYGSIDDCGNNNDERKKALRRLAPYIQLACKNLSLRLKALIKEQEDGPEKASIIQTLALVHARAKWLVAIPVVAEYYRWGPTTSLEISVQLANVSYQRLMEQLRGYDSSADLQASERLAACKRVWQNVLSFLEVSQDASVIKEKEVTRKLKLLQEQIDQYGEVELTSKRPLQSPSLPAQKKVKTADTRTTEEIMALLDFDPRKSHTLNWYDMRRVVSDTGAPYPQAKDMVALIDGAELSDLVIDPYMTLLCQYANGQGGMDIERPGSPMWHAWSTWFPAQVEKGTNVKAWPPAGYPAAKIEQVANHIFPIHMDQNHWGMAVLSRGELDFYSSIPGYETKLAEVWAPIESWLMAVGVQVGPFKVPSQPRQNNAVDCGVFICCEVRWLIEGWPLATLEQKNVTKLRRRMTVELDNWSVSLAE